MHKLFKSYSRKRFLSFSQKAIKQLSRTAFQVHNMNYLMLCLLCLLCFLSILKLNMLTVLEKRNFLYSVVAGKKESHMGLERPAGE